ncbi:hypothetical protein B7494_g7752 [Chlorociboria aeruginascens]|nr:hypothetical protein B7494_g7752 [Chlorociboria aeruginascens]
MCDAIFADKPTVGRERLVSHFSVDSSQHGSRWDTLWAENFIPWDQGSAHPALIDALSHRTDLLGSPVMKDSSGTERRKRALVPGCGKGYDVLVFASFGYDAWGLEVSETAIKACEELEKETRQADEYQVKNRDVGKGAVNFIHGDFYGTEWQGQASDRFDVIYDYTFLCAMPPDKRPEWALRMSQLLSPEGRLFCIEFPTYNRPAVGGPPWAVRKETYLEHLKRPGEKIPYDEDSFVVVEDAQANSDALKRIAHWKPEKTHPLGVGTDWVSVWEHI